MHITQAILAGIRRVGRGRGRGQVDGLNWQNLERVCIYAETEGALTGLRDVAMIRHADITRDAVFRHIRSHQTVKPVLVLLSGVKITSADTELHI